jgi:response regulator RpfG family c-di-GMP phosphodiesterase/signal transduction histidine kinase
MNLADATRPEMSCRAAMNFGLYFESTYGRERLEKAYRSMGEALPLSYIFDPKNFISFEFGCKLIDALADESGDPDFAMKAGKFIASPQALGFVYHMLRALGTPRLAYEKLISIGPTFNKVGEFKIDAISDTHMMLRYRSLRPEPNRRSCQVRIGQFAAFTTIWGLPEAAYVEHQCQVLGAPDCVYELNWRRVSRPLLASAIGAAAGGAASAIILANAVGPAQGSLLGLVVGGALGAAFNYRTLAKSLQAQLSTQDEGMSLSMRDLQSRMEEIQEFNQTLEQRVAQRTEELSLATTQLQAALEKQIELDRAKTHFFQNISHELRTPLTLILAPLDTLADTPGLSPDARMQLDVMRRSALRLLGMINSLLDLSRLESGKVRLALDEIDPAFVCREMVENAQQLARKRGVQLSYTGPATLPLVALDQDKFEKIVVNLISNALKFTGTEKGRTADVELSAKVIDERLVVAVRDTGIGIPKNELSNIFLRFHQVDGSDERRFGGTGIGLALVKELTEFHMGAVRVESTLGEGSTFTVLFPTNRDVYPDDRLDRRRASENVAVDRRKEAERAKLSQLIANPADLALADLQPAASESIVVSEAVPGRTSILLADDNADMLAYLATILGREYDVITAVDGDQAFSLATQRLPAIIVSDVMMPGKNGYALIKALKTIPATRSIPVILVTAKADSYQRVAGIESGADDYITKPFNFMELRARIRQLLKARALERSLAEKNDYLAKLNFDLVLSKKEVFVQTIEALAFALEAKDPYTHGHSRRVSLLSTEVGRQLSLSDLEIERVRMSAVLHDIGKLGIPEHILRKEGRLTADEESIIRRHPEIGFRILESVRELSEVNRCILLHHEKFDGTGYPDQRGGHEIPLESRIIAVADTYDAMTSDRPYRSGMGHKRAIEELRNFSGSQFDPDCVRGFLKLYETHPPVFPEFPSVFTKMRLLP